MSRTTLLAAATAVAAIALTACGGSSGGDYGGYGATAPVGGAAESLAPPPGMVLSANSTAQLGTVVIDGSGWTLYRFDGDTAAPPASTCIEQCAVNWPPVLAEPGTPLTVEGVDQAMIGTITRPDGGIQLTIGGWPVYRFGADSAPGATDGHGVGGTWFAVTPTGGRAEAP